MSNSPIPATNDPYIQRLKDSRNKNAVLKLRLALLRSHLPTVPVLAFEGVEDKIIYFHWLKRIRPDFTYEPFPCNGKKQIFMFRDMLARDLGGLKERVYYFVDRDFDDLAGHAPDADLFMTDYYATENYLVCDAVLSELLKNEFHCHARPDVRGAIIAVFQNAYADFLSQTRDINLRLFIAKKLSIELISHVPQKVNDIASVALSTVAPGPKSAAEIVKFKSDPSASDASIHEADFNNLDPPTRYRGKFALLFFEKWLELLADDYENSTKMFFAGIDRSSKVQRKELTLGNFASKAPFPSGLAGFISAIA